MRLETEAVDGPARDNVPVWPSLARDEMFDDLPPDVVGDRQMIRAASDGMSSADRGYAIEC